MIYCSLTRTGSWSIGWEIWNWCWYRNAFSLSITQISNSACDCRFNWNWKTSSFSICNLVNWALGRKGWSKYNIWSWNYRCTSSLSIWFITTCTCNSYSNWNTISCSVSLLTWWTYWWNTYRWLNTNSIFITMISRSTETRYNWSYTVSLSITYESSSTNNYWRRRTRL